MRLPLTLRIVLLLLPAFLPALVLPVLAQSGTTPRRLTFDGISTPLDWDAGGISVSRPGARITERGQTRIANELWRVNPASGESRQVSADVLLTGRAPSGISSLARVFVVNPESLQPELWLSEPSGANPRLLLRGDSEYFGAPILSPDGRRFVFVRAPTGSETHVFSAIWLGDVQDASVRLFAVEASAPVWSPDGAEIAFEHRGDVYVASASATIAAWSEQPAPSAPAAPAALTPPATIRVKHMQANADFSAIATCRPTTLIVGSIMTIPFETYVSWVLPIEASPSNPPEHLKAQAVAARTYAWNRINPANPYDVTDWTDTQAMCDLRADPRTDAATNATASQYIAYNGQVIPALYSAENGDPTRKSPFGCTCPYLDAVDDPVSFGKARLGHGGGFSQKGSQRWASWHRWTYIQILTHYYSSVTIEGQTNFGGFSRPWNQWWQNSNRLRITGNASNGNTLAFSAAGVGLSSTLVASNTLIASLDVSSLPDQPMGAFVISGTLFSTQIATLTLGIDRALPTGTLTLPSFVNGPTISVTLQAVGNDSGPSGYAGYGLSNGWIWEGEDKVAQGHVAGAGAVVGDAAALNGAALYAPNGSGGVWYGPYTYALPLGRPYRAYFRMKTSDNITTSELAKIDVVADGLNPIGIKRIYGTDFRAANVYQEFAVDVNYVDTPTMGVEFRVDFPGRSALWLDRVLVATYPVTTPTTTVWAFPQPPYGTKTVIAKFSDNAGNVSPDVVGTTYIFVPHVIFLPLVVSP